MSLSPLVSFNKSRFVTYLLNFPRRWQSVRFVAEGSFWY